MIPSVSSLWRSPWRSRGDASRKKGMGAGQETTAARTFNQAQRGSAIEISKETVFKIACNYEGYSNEAIDPKLIVRARIANTFDVTAYDILPEVQKELYQEEINRLSSAIIEANAQRTFTGTQRFDSDTQEAYETMASLSNQMWTALNIITYDVELLLKSYYPDLHSEHRMQQSRQSLKYLTKNDDDSDNGDDDEDDEDEDHEKSAFPKLDYDGSRQDYFELVNYITEILTRVLLKSAYGKLWHENIIACMAKISTKMKVLSTKLEEFASVSLSQTPARPKLSMAGVAHVRGTGNQPIQRDGPVEGLDIMQQSLSALLDPQDMAGENRESRRHGLSRFYWAETMMFQKSIERILRHVLLSLRGVKKHKATSTTSYDLCAMLYETGFEDFRTLVFQDLNGEYLGSSKDENINTAQSVFEVLNSTVEGVVVKSGSQGQPPPQRPPDPSSDKASQRISADRPEISHESGQFSTVGTVVSWSYVGTAPSDESRSKEPKPSAISTTNYRPKTHHMRSMNETITVMAPMLMSNPTVVDMITDFVGLIVQTSRVKSDNVQDQVKVRQGTKFKVFFSLTTQDYVDSWKKSQHPASSQLSRAPMTRDKLFSGKASEDIPKGTMPLDLPIAVAQSERNRQMKDDEGRFMRWEREIRDAKRKMNEWVFEETGVRVFCEFYVWSVLAVAATLVAGGIASGLTIQERIKGVDPFGIATFSWVFAGFIILIAKSTRVGNWSWRDFLHRQVLCRSVSELHYVTGIDSQLSLAKLLHDESGNRLQTRGPYNCVFARRTDSAEGFSIDRPLTIRTMLLSGLVMIQVQAPYYGEFLVCLDVRKGTSVHLIEKNSDPTEEESYIVSNTVPDFSLSVNEPLRIPLRRGTPSWKQVVGVYGQRDCSFI
ncbi:hypothetical protein F4824DRAFT_478735 [Ustulina deusta]|nr:hypothetical protein F4824DRAFT_478735 [Ustulina deusta]